MSRAFVGSFDNARKALELRLKRPLTSEEVKALRPALDAMRKEAHKQEAQGRASTKMTSRIYEKSPQSHTQIVLSKPALETRIKRGGIASSYDAKIKKIILTKVKE